MLYFTHRMLHFHPQNAMLNTAEKCEKWAKMGIFDYVLVIFSLMTIQGLNSIIHTLKTSIFSKDLKGIFCVKNG